MSGTEAFPPMASSCPISIEMPLASSPASISSIRIDLGNVRLWCPSSCKCQLVMVCQICGCVSVAVARGVETTSLISSSIGSSAVYGLDSDIMAVVRASAMVFWRGHTIPSFAPIVRISGCKCAGMLGKWTVTIRGFPSSRFMASTSKSAFHSSSMHFPYLSSTGLNSSIPCISNGPCSMI